MRLNKEGTKLSRPRTRSGPLDSTMAMTFVAGLLLLSPSRGVALQVGNLTGEMSALQCVLLRYGSLAEGCRLTSFGERKAFRFDFNGDDLNVFVHDVVVACNSSALRE